jgi:hypothetical protein
MKVPRASAPAAAASETREHGGGHQGGAGWWSEEAPGRTRGIRAGARGGGGAAGDFRGKPPDGAPSAMGLKSAWRRPAAAQP